jgi:predicted dehydrogenase
MLLQFASRSREWRTGTCRVFSSTPCIGPTSRSSESPSRTGSSPRNTPRSLALDQSLLFSDLEEMLRKTHPQAVLAYTNTYDHRRVVEVCARYGVHVMMEKPLAVSAEDAHAMERAARQGKIQVLVNYETTWYRSNRAAYDLVHDQSIGEIRKFVAHDGHQGPQEIGVGPEFLAWLNDPKLNGGGALYDFGCYGADLITWLMDGQAAYHRDRRHPANQTESYIREWTTKLR